MIRETRRHISPYRVAIILLGLGCYVYGKSLRVFGLHRDKRLGLLLLALLSAALLADGYHGIAKYRATVKENSLHANGKSSTLQYNISITEVICGLICTSMFFYFICL